MNGFLLMVPFFGVRFGLLGVLGKEAVHRAAHFAPMYGKEQVAYFVYQLATAAVVVYPAFLTVKPGLTWHFLLGLLCGGLGLILCIASMGAFARPDDRGMCASGVYRLSRNPIYLGYFLYFAGCALMTASPVLMGVVLIFQVSAHWIVLAEERWCLEHFGESYHCYMKQVRRYL